MASFSLSLSASKVSLTSKAFMGKQVARMTTRMTKLAVSPVAQPLTVQAQQKSSGGKLKTNKAAAKRFRVTGTGKVRVGAIYRAAADRSGQLGGLRRSDAWGEVWGRRGWGQLAGDVQTINPRRQPPRRGAGWRNGRRQGQRQCPGVEHTVQAARSRSTSA
jgi:hypothetical protein